MTNCKPRSQDHVLSESACPTWDRMGLHILPRIEDRKSSTALSPRLRTDPSVATRRLIRYRKSLMITSEIGSFRRPHNYPHKLLSQCGFSGVFNCVQSESAMTMLPSKPLKCSMLSDTSDHRRPLPTSWKCNLITQRSKVQILPP
jgi:hypothetical protein